MEKKKSPQYNKGKEKVVFGYGGFEEKYSR